MIFNKIEKNALQKIIDDMIILIILAVLIFTINNYSNLSGSVPVHFGFNVEFDSFIEGDNTIVSIFSMIILSIVVYLIRSMQFK